MPARTHSKKVNSPRRERMHNAVAASMEKRGYSRGRAISAANAVVKRDYLKGGKRKKKARKTYR